MFRSYLVFGLQLFVTLIVCCANKSAISKRLQKCLDYSTKVYGEDVPHCETSSGNSGVIPIHEFPHIAILGYRNYDDETIAWHCHGTLVSTRYVLTVGYCMRNPRTLPTTVKLGATSNGYLDETNTSDYDIEEIILHPFFNAGTYYNNVGLIKLSRNVEISENVRPICLPDSDLQANSLYQVNYKRSETNNPLQRPLTKREQNVVSNNECNELLTNIRRRFRYGITDELMCSKKSSNTFSDHTCLGDLGAPLYINHSHVACSHIQLGISSFKVNCDTVSPVVATKVFIFSDWIESVIWAEDDDH